MVLLESMVIDYLRAAARGATSNETVTFYLGGAGRPDLFCIIVDYLRVPWPRARPPCIANASVPKPSPVPGPKAQTDFKVVPGLRDASSLQTLNTAFVVVPPVVVSDRLVAQAGALRGYAGGKAQADQPQQERHDSAEVWLGLRAHDMI
jgi:hypothetical protein